MDRRLEIFRGEGGPGGPGRQWEKLIQFQTVKEVEVEVVVGRLDALITIHWWNEKDIISTGHQCLKN